MITTLISSAQILNSDYARARTLLLPQYNEIQLVLVGCGGTGSWLAPSAARVARLLMEKFDKRVALTFIDPDKIEEKNLYRQNFCQAEIGLNKAEALAFRYGLAWGVEIRAETAIFDPKKVRYLIPQVIIGCVDNAAARRSIKKAVEGHADIWWLDCGNARGSGQVLLGGGGARTKEALALPAHCAWLPLPSDRHPELLDDQVEALAEDPQNLSCADLAMLDSQGLAINQRIAAEATDYLVRMLLTKDLQKMATYIDLASGSARSVYITEEALR